MQNNEYKKIIDILKIGGAVVYPTDTAYGLGVDATNLSAVVKMYNIKGRGDQPTHIIVSDVDMAMRYVEFSEKALAVFNHFLPGALTIVLPLKDNVLGSIKRLSANGNTIGIRMPDSELILNLVKELNSPITATSANPAGGETPYSIFKSKEQFVSKEFKPDYFLDKGELEKIKPSTMIRIDGDDLKILREGPIAKEEILNFLKNI